VKASSQLPPNPARLSPAIARLFPPGVIAAEMREPGEAALLYPSEAAQVSRAVPKRVREFAAGRACARRALGELGIEGFELRAAPDRQPMWPSSVIGSITHTRGLCAAVVAEKGHLAAIGIDSEGVGNASQDIWDSICGPAETAWRRSLPDSQQAAAVTLLFCAKEAFYKCQFPLTGEWLDFHDLRVEPQAWGAPESRFAVHFMRSLAIEAHRTLPPIGRYRVHAGIVTAGVALERAPGSQ
jgi:4'-phosphopantetheinyl transferase EntD